MAEFCIVCECEPIDTDDWFFNEKNWEWICPWCIKDLHNIKEIVKRMNNH